MPEMEHGRQGVPAGLALGVFFSAEASEHQAITRYEHARHTASAKPEFVVRAHVDRIARLDRYAVDALVVGGDRHIVLSDNPQPVPFAPGRDADRGCRVDLDPAAGIAAVGFAEN